MAAQAAELGLGEAASADLETPAAQLLAQVGTGRAVLALAVGVNRLAEVAERFTGVGSGPGMDEVIAAIDRLGEAVDRLAG
jgi:hypothetical protein